MSGEWLVRLSGVGKRYPVVGARGDRLSALGRLLLGRPPRREVPVLSGIDLEVRRGESLAIIGENGAGKSTLLKLITGTLTPSEGRIERRGRIGALLELGAGFHPEYSGRDNVRMAAALHGLSGAALQARLPEIEDFAAIGRYFDEPVKHYSSGMAMRLGFAVVAATRPDLLITDEVLAVGDERFQKKCIRWIDSYLAGGGTLLLVSHSPYHVRKLCRHALWLREGRIEDQGEAHDVSRRYEAWLEGRDAAAGEAAAEGLPEYRIESLALSLVGGRLSVRLAARSREGDRPHLLVGLVRADGTPVYGVSTEIDGQGPWPLPEGGFGARLELDVSALLPGRYRFRAHTMDPEALRVFHTVEQAFDLPGESREFGFVRLPHRWEAP
ncbi:MAG: hypothetical protein KatS3mg127_1451 [Silanimonas sp.]|nr:MAG: hypothetical protein KatS3mg127_1451 [Silanimonas sp.]